ncbi:hypothetical protein ISF_05632 [Cordyceps fumosorosea ARSEF 2679]|uniref:Uncharacterized protein n=1 Tax=Cordyceps fumosorosea (strain ARSEF 2679) TaxID=1081104 RepID=A0A167UGD2_CORFA|nr:hypothetical protein ISF_05632 [Cordyceps fumosorosea ARSEF 2679]OAA61553.1 hypothetical protein ISF_05632 [Cordyceps fumosorosea ARSEF 2679]
MARRRKTPKEAAPAISPTAITRSESPLYNMALSRQRLEREGFRPLATHQSVQETIESWEATIKSQIRAADDDHDRPRQMTRAFLILREEPELRPEKQHQHQHQHQHQPDAVDFETIITSQGIGPLILTHVFAGGHRDALNLALTSKRTWVVLAASVNYYDFYAGRQQNLGLADVLVCGAPRFTLEEMMATHREDPYGFREATAATAPFTAWHNAAISREEDAINTLFAVRKRLSVGPEETPRFLEEAFKPETLNTIRKIKDVNSIFKANQFNSQPPQSIFEPQMIFSATRLQLLLINIFKQRKSLQVLHFHNTPFFDRRILAIVLRACPYIVTLGVYNCPLIHLGDVIPLLDLIYEINSERRRKNTPLITSFDFYPSFHQGLAGSGRNESVYGLTADCLDRDIVQRGVYAILLKSFLKARQMKLRLLFEPRQSLRKFLSRLPNPALSIPTFFDGLSRYLENGPQKRQALFDLTKPIRLGIEPNLEDDRHYRDEMGKYLPFCSSCGYELLYEFFPAGVRGNPPELRVCAGCNLQDLLDQQQPDMRDWKVGLLGKLMEPGWDGRAFNADAPTSGESEAPENDLMRLRTTVTLRTDPSPIHIGSNGELVPTRYIIQLIRDNKCPEDSLRNLPSLRDLAEDLGERWGDLFNHCNRADTHARARRRLRDEAEVEAKAKAEALGRPLTRRPHDYYGEVWRRKRHAQEVQTFNYWTAAQFHLALERKGW